MPVVETTVSTQLRLDVTYDAVALRVAERDEAALAALSDDDRLLYQYSPILYILPDGVVETPPPYLGRNDYHPRSVEMFFDRVVKVGVAIPRGIGAVAFWCVLAGYLLAAEAILVFNVTGTQYLFFVDKTVAISIVLLATFAVIVIMLAWRQRTRSVSEVQQEMAGTRRLGGIFRGGIGSLYVSMSLPDAIAVRESIWTDYCANVVASSKYPRTIYGRVLRLGDRIALEYWQFYLYNDWWNLHQADWELAAVYLRQLEDGAVEPKAAAYSSHFGGRFRPWGLVGRHGDHPEAYVARGSHALYFAPDPGGYPTQLRTSFGLGFRGTAILEGATDRVGQPSGTGSLPYQLVTVPRGASTLLATDPDWERWWWLQYPGKWGWDSWWWVPLRDRVHREDAIEGPAVQESGIKWLDPWAWGAACVADSGSWLSTGA